MASRELSHTAGSVTSGQTHTPGPWQTRDDHTFDGSLTIIGNVDGEYVEGRAECTYDTVALCLDEYGETLPNALANARLIQQAPELLRGAKALIALTWNVDHIRNTPAMRDLCAAIANAEAR